MNLLKIACLIGLMGVTSAFGTNPTVPSSSSAPKTAPPPEGFQLKITKVTLLGTDTSATLAGGEVIQADHTYKFKDKSGKVLGEYQVLEITEDEVVARYGGKKYSFKIGAGMDGILEKDGGSGDSASSSASPVPPGSASNKFSIDPGKGKQLRADLEERMGYMEKEPLAVWPEREPEEDIRNAEPPKAQFKVQKQDGSIDYLEKAPDPKGGYGKVWFKSNPETVMIRYVGPGGGTVGTADATPKKKWVRQYYQSKTGEWSSVHPNELGFKSDHEYALGILNGMEEAINPDAARKANSLWFELLNARAGAAKSEADIQSKIQGSSDDLRWIALQLGEAAGLKDLLWRIHQISITVDPRVNPATSIEKRVALSRERRALIKEAISGLGLGGASGKANEPVSGKVSSSPSRSGDLEGVDLKAMNDPKTAVPELIKNLQPTGNADFDNGDGREMRMQAAVQLKEFRKDAKDAIPALEKAMKNDPDADVREASKRALELIRWGIAHNVGRNAK